MIEVWSPEEKITAIEMSIGAAAFVDKVSNYLLIRRESSV